MIELGLDLIREERRLWILLKYDVADVIAQMPLALELWGVISHVVWVRDISIPRFREI